MMSSDQVNMSVVLCDNLTLNCINRSLILEDKPTSSCDVDRTVEGVWDNGQIAWTFAFSFIVVTSIVGNSIVLWIVLAHRSMWSVTNYFLVNLTLADILLATLNCAFSFVFMRDRNWIFGSVFCVINNFVSYVTVASSVFTLLAVTCDRRKAILYPLQPKTSKLCALVTILAIWTCSGLLALPAFFFSKHVIIACGRSACILVWPDGPQHKSTFDYIYNLLFFLLTYLMPMFVMGGCYLQMGRTLWAKADMGEETPALRKSRKSKHKVVKMFLVLVSIFMICWLPYHIYFIYAHHNPSIVRKKYIGHVYLGFYWLAMANCCVNPFIYYWMSDRFRKYFNSLLVCLPTHSRVRRVTTRIFKPSIELQLPDTGNLTDGNGRLGRGWSHSTIRYRTNSNESNLQNSVSCRLNPSPSFPVRALSLPPRRNLGPPRQSINSCQHGQKQSVASQTISKETIV